MPSSYLFFLNLALFLYPQHDFWHIGLQDHASHHKFIKDAVNLVIMTSGMILDILIIQQSPHLVHVEDQIQLTDVLKAFVQSLHKDLDEVQDAELWLRAVHTEDEVESGVVSVYELVVGASDQTAALQKVANIVVPLGDQLEGLLDYLLLLWFIL